MRRESLRPSAFHTTYAVAGLAWRREFDFVIYDGLDEMDAVGPMEVMRSAGRAGAALDVWLVTRVPQSLVTGAYGLRFVPDGTFVARPTSSS